MKYVPIIIPIFLALAIIVVTLYRPYVPNPSPVKNVNSEEAAIVLADCAETALQRRWEDYARA